MKKQVLVIYREADRAVPYRDALVAAGIDPSMQAAHHPLSLKGFDGLVLTGGSDVDPALYGETRRPETDPPDRERDALEAQLLKDALARDLPVLAICRGLQMLNVFEGGTLVQHLGPLDRHQRTTGPRDQPAHEVSIEPGTLLAEIARADTMHVNSRHHQAVARVGGQLRISAIDPEDGIVEALEHRAKKFVLAVQWHPEDQALVDSRQLEIFRRFGEALEDN